MHRTAIDATDMWQWDPPGLGLIDRGNRRAPKVRVKRQNAPEPWLAGNPTTRHLFAVITAVLRGNAMLRRLAGQHRHPPVVRAGLRDDDHIVRRRTVHSPRGGKSGRSRLMPCCDKDRRSRRRRRCDHLRPHRFGSSTRHAEV